MTAWHLAAAGAVAAVIWALPAAAQGDAPTAARYVEAAAGSDAFEMAEAQAVLAGSRNPQVRAYAEAMLRDHGGLAASLRAAAAAAMLPPPPAQVGVDQVLLLAALQGLEGAEFDRAYAEHQALAHRAALTVQQGYAARGDDPALRRAAAAAVPVIERHLAEAERLKATATP